MNFQVGIFHMTTGALRNGFDMAGYAARKDVNEAAEKVREGIKEARYVLCAQVEAKSLEDAYRLTQNDFFEDGWASSAKWAAQHRDGRNQQRSSMVGDLFLFNGDAYIVGAIGFTKLPADIVRTISDFGFDGRTGTAFDDTF
jgi:hypothetical protein